MTLDELKAILLPFALGLRADFDPPTQRAYHRVLSDVSPALLQAAVDDANHEPDLRFMPTAPEMRGRCEKARAALLQANRYEGCVDCEHSPGWLMVVGENAVRRCPCLSRHRERLERMGIAVPLAKQTPRHEDADPERPLMLDDAPPAMSDRIRALAAGKVLR